MSDAVWERHANPWSAWTRIATCLPLFAVAVWSRVWLGWWSLAPVAASLLWIWLNPRIFAPPRSTDNWASEGVMGERLWLDRKRTPIPARHRIAPMVLMGVAACGLPPFAWGLWSLRLCPTLAGCLLMYLGKLWFFDRMAWLYQDMRGAAAQPAPPYTPYR